MLMVCEFESDAELIEVDIEWGTSMTSAKTVYAGTGASVDQWHVTFPKSWQILEGFTQERKAHSRQYFQYLRVSSVHT
jgi:hypothetical protein